MEEQVLRISAVKNIFLKAVRMEETEVVRRPRHYERNANEWTLLPLRYTRHVKAERGENGGKIS
jgi:hypothetical protein